MNSIDSYDKQPSLAICNFFKKLDEYEDISYSELIELFEEIKLDKNYILERYLYTPVHLAVAFGCKEHLEKIVKTGISLDDDEYSENWEFTPLELAVRLDNAMMLEVLHKSGCKFDEKKLDILAEKYHSQKVKQYLNEFFNRQ